MPDHPNVTILTPIEAAEILRTGARTLERWRTAGGGPAYVKVGRRVGYTLESLTEYVERQTRRHTHDVHNDARHMRAGA